jgi:hypothetical protein
MTELQKPNAETSANASAISRWDDEGGARRQSSTTPAGRPHALARLVIDESEHNRDGLLLHSWDRDDAVTITAFLSRKVIDAWVHEQEMPASRKSLFRSEYTPLGKLNLPAIERIVAAKYQRSAAFDQPYPFVDVLLADIVGSREALDVGALPPLT